jgi:glycosyltransferase involved in cell wall biosynthesis
VTGERLRFLLLNQFYPPDRAPTGRLLHDVAADLAARDHDVTVVCSRRSYSEGEDLGPGGLLDGVRIERIGGTALDRRTDTGRVAEYVRYLGAALIRGLGRTARPDLVVAMTTPPYLGVVAALAGRLRGIRHAHWIMDVFPDALNASGRVRYRGAASSLLRAVARWQFRHATVVVTPGPFVQARMERHCGPHSRIVHVPLWSDAVAALSTEEDAARIRTARGWRVDDVVLLYSGNMGVGHRFSEFLQAAQRLAPSGPIWAFVGGGYRHAEVAEFRHLHPETRIELMPYVPRESLAASLAAADVHLVSLREGWGGIISPSKLQAAFSVGRPVIFVGPPDNEASGGGWSVREGDVDGLINTVRAAADVAERRRRGRAALEYARVHFDRERNRTRIADLFEECAAQPERAPSSLEV